MKFKTNVMCASCVAKVTPNLDKVAGEHNWEVDIKDPQKILTVKNDRVKAGDIINALKSVGYKSELV